MHDTTSHPARSGSSSFISPESIVQKLLAFIGGAHSGSDLERIRFWVAMQLPPHELSDRQYFEEEEGYQAFTQEVADTRWSYIVSLNQGSSESGLPRVRLAFESPNGVAQDFAPVCRIDFESFRIALVGKGFVEGPPNVGKTDHAIVGRRKAWLIRDDISIHILAQQDAGQPGAKEGRFCLLAVEARSLSNHEARSR